jgi:hypothetical protein
LQQLNLGGAQSQQSWRALTLPPPVPPHTSPSGSQLCGLLQVPIGGLVPATMLHTMLPAPGPPTGPPQQSVDLVHTSPITRQPLATWQVRPPVAVVAQRRLQQLVPSVHAWPSTSQPPEPVLLKAPHVPAVFPAPTLHTPLQQSVDLKQMSPRDAHDAPEPAQRPP